ncbi:Hypothetical protein P9303_20221 [Prochlorococcus marinus str. MIT 9303]|uniref:Uncharacterized protein n=1 Tax=Prochlorococcus marinus (strain MIT 9303) TaxID=59922 RepID=A2CBA1_PROM3|nr:Hypothetical protein P9303_20191 [Prochlorococcus marinus str. MIT 9303]ABM78764.1 Hypothetical protein P9303_20221 [Prochlorococcus marinus str. MIT 9303]
MLGPNNLLRSYLDLPWEFLFGDHLVNRRLRERCHLFYLIQSQKFYFISH